MCNITIQEKNNGHFHTGHYLKGYENIYSSLEEIEFDECYIIPNDIDNSDECPYSSALDFLHGACHLFAYMLYQLFGYEVFKIKTENNDNIHWYAQKIHQGKKAYIDVRGATTDYDEFILEFKESMGTDYEIIKRNKEQDVELQEFNDFWSNTGKVFAVAIIDDNVDYYKL